MSTRKKTVLRTIRISEELDRLIQKDAKEKRTSVNAMVAGMLEKYAEWDRFTAKYGFVSCSQDLFRSLLASSVEEELVKNAKHLGDRQPKEFLYLWFKKLDSDGLQRFLSLISKYATSYQYDMEIEGRTLIFNAHHDYGEKWSKFLESFFGQAARGFGYVPQLEHTTEHVMLRVQIP